MSYRVTARLHDGAQTVLTKATREVDGRTVVLKELTELYPSAAALSAFRREYDLLRLAAGEGVVEALGFEVDRGVARLVLEDFGGISLVELFAARRPSLRETLDIACALARALTRVHDAGIIHKDITPANVVFAPATGTLKLIDFGIATTIPRANAVPIGRTTFQGTPAFMSPEQTGRMNRSLDYRSDLYSVGATLYWLLCQRPPFDSDDILELVHAHIAKTPPAPCEVERRVPEALSQIAMTLMAKRSEDRYQSAAGLLNDLELCRHDLGELGEIRSFPLRSRDLRPVLTLPQTLYGRDAEVRTLERAFHRVCGGGSEIVTVAGYSGIGKSSLVGEVYRDVATIGGYFVAGRVDQFGRSEPYGAVLGAFRELLGRILAESDGVIEGWRTALSESLGELGAVLCEVIPELGLVLGDQQPVPELSPAETENRFHLAMMRFARALGRPAQPMVVFLDDLQWADLASLRFFEQVARDDATRHLLLIGAYRANEVTATHPLAHTLQTLRERELPLTELALQPLTLDDIRRWVAAALLRPRDAEIDALAELLAEKTGGNPFFMGQFLENLHRSGVLRVDRAAIRWTADMPAARREHVTENVVDLMTARIRELPIDTRRTLEMAAWLGRDFRLEVLAALLEEPRSAIQRALDVAIAEALVLPIDEDYWVSDAEAEQAEASATRDFRFRFVHDRVEQAAAALLTDDQAREVRLRVGRLVLSEVLGVRPDGRGGDGAALGGELQILDGSALFDVVGHLNAASELIAAPSERRRLMDLNAEASRRALSSADYAAGHDYARLGVALARPEDWRERYGPTLGLYLLAAEAAYLDGDHGAMEALVARLLESATSQLDRTRAKVIRVNAFVARNEHGAGVAAGLEALAELGVVLPREPAAADVEAGLRATLEAVATLSTAELLNLPVLADPALAEARRLSINIASAAYLAAPNLLPLLAFEIVRSSVRHGVSPQSAFGFVVFGLVLGAVRMFESAYAMGRLAVDLLDRFDDRALHARVRHVFNTHIRVFAEPIRVPARTLPEVFLLGQDTGDLEYACWAAHNHCVFALYAGEPLDELDRTFARYGSAMVAMGQLAPHECHRPFAQLVANLRGETLVPSRLRGPTYDADSAVTALEAAGFRGALFLTATARTIAAYLFNDAAEALRAAEGGEPYQDGAASTVHLPLFYFFKAMAHLRLAQDLADDTEREAHLARALEAREQVAQFAAACEENHGHRLALIDAERAAIADDEVVAMGLYDDAARRAQRFGLVADHALAMELGGRFHLSMGRDTVARAYLLEARSGWQRWGARGKSEHLTQQFGDLLRRTRDGGGGSGSSTVTMTAAHAATTTAREGGSIDLESVFRAHQALSSEMRLDALLGKVMGVILRAVGGTRGFLLVERDRRLLVQASEDAEGNEICPRGTPSSACEALPNSIVQYVARTGEELVLGDARSDGRFRGELLLLGGGPLSVHCGPIHHKGHRVGMVYVENDLSAGAFTPDRTQVISLLGTQAAISLENARLYEETRDMARSFARFVPSEFVRTLGHRRVDEVDVGDSVTRDITVMFSDLRGFTRLFEHLGAAEGFGVLNAYLGTVSPIIERNGGFVDKFIGDAIMALFPGEADGAVRAAVEMASAVRALNGSGRLPPGIQLASGVGLHAGPVMLGAVGASDRLDLTAIGDTVNTASRIEGLTSALGAPVLISEAVRDRLRASTARDVRRLGPVRVYGRQHPIELCELFSVDPPAVVEAKRSTTEAFHAAVAAYRSGDGQRCRELLTRCLETCPSDAVAAAVMELARRPVTGDVEGLQKGRFDLA
jgi:predicted ATPase/class 3 adenylate cyclase